MLEYGWTLVAVFIAATALIAAVKKMNCAEAYVPKKANKQKFIYGKVFFVCLLFY